MAQSNEFVDLVTTDVFTPYRKDEVFRLPKDQADLVLEKAGNKVRKFDPKRDSELLELNGNASLEDLGGTDLDAAKATSNENPEGVGEAGTRGNNDAQTQGADGNANPTGNRGNGRR